LATTHFFLWTITLMSEGLVQLRGRVAAESA
jgi:hypothetical protein